MKHCRAVTEGSSPSEYEFNSMPNWKQPHTKKRISNGFKTLHTFTGIYRKDKNNYENY